MIPIKINNNKTYSKKIKEYYNFIDSNSFFLLVCPKCNTKGQLKRNTSYSRNYISTIDEKYDDFTPNELNVFEEIIIITVVKCTACGKYHALLPTFILPYHIYSAYFIMLALINKVIKNESVQKILNYLSISHRLFYYWLKVFHKYIPSASVVLEANNNDPPIVLQLIITKLDLFINQFYEQYNIIFFLNTVNHLFY